MLFSVFSTAVSVVVVFMVFGGVVIRQGEVLEIGQGGSLPYSWRFPSNYKAPSVRSSISLVACRGLEAWFQCFGCNT